MKLILPMPPFCRFPIALRQVRPSIAQAIALGTAITYIQEHIDFTHLTCP